MPQTYIGIGIYKFECCCSLRNIITGQYKLNCLVRRTRLCRSCHAHVFKEKLNVRKSIQVEVWWRLRQHLPELSMIPTEAIVADMQQAIETIISIGRTR